MDKYEGLRKKLAEQKFPCKYMFKFITLEENLAELKPYFEDAEVKTKPSSKGKYISLTAVIMALSADEIIDRYKSLSHIKGLISL
ncbi:MAG: DUF493 domain-containing protein [Flavobacteriales bacterium]|nr:DUF493 domain-containing protein [Flavobacteriales bacterium]|tara:strand:- start:55193 stop:55447 length:255 start_codon:yes stop_codon:yes gene_type:complete